MRKDFSPFPQRQFIHPREGRDEGWQLNIQPSTEGRVDDKKKTTET
jgi:hypothetical protein